MKSTTRSKVYLPMAAMILTAALAVPAAAQHQVPFKGALQGNDFDIAFTDTSVTVLTVGTGIGTHVGQFSFTQTVTVDFTTARPHVNRVGSVDCRQWRQHLYDGFRIR